MGDFVITIEEKIGLTAQPVPNLDSIVNSMLEQDAEVRADLTSTELVIQYFHQILDEIADYPTEENTLFLIDKPRLSKYITSSGKAFSLKTLAKRAEFHEIDNLFSFQPVSNKYGIEWLVLPTKEQLELISQRATNERTSRELYIQKKNPELDVIYETEITPELVHSYFELKKDEWSTVQYVCGVIKHLSENLKEDMSVDKTRLKELVASFSQDISENKAAVWITKVMKETGFVQEKDKGEVWYTLGDTDTIDMVFEKFKPVPKKEKQPRPTRTNPELDAVYETGINLEVIKDYFGDFPKELQPIHYVYGLLKHLDSVLTEDRAIDKNRLKEIVASFSDDISERQASVWINKFMKKAEFPSKGSITDTWYELGDTETIDRVFSELEPRPKEPRLKKQPRTNTELELLYQNGITQDIIHNYYETLEPDEWEAVQYVCGILKHLSENLSDKHVDKTMLSLQVSELAGVSTRVATSAINKVVSSAGIKHTTSFKEIWYDLTDKTESIDKVFEEFRPEPRKRNIELDKIISAGITKDSIVSYYELNMGNWNTIHYVCAVLKHISENLVDDMNVDKKTIIEQVSKVSGVSERAASRAVSQFFNFATIAPDFLEYQDNRNEPWYKIGDTSTIDTIFERSVPKPTTKKRFSGDNERLTELYISGIGIKIIENYVPEPEDGFDVVHYIYGVLKHLDKNLFPNNKYVDKTRLKELVASFSDEISERQASVWITKFIKQAGFKEKKSGLETWYEIGDVEKIDSAYEILRPKKKIEKQVEEPHENKILKEIYQELKESDDVFTRITRLHPELGHIDRSEYEPIHYIQATLSYISEKLPNNNNLVDRDGLVDIICFLRPDFPEKRVKANITRAINKIGYNILTIAGETWYELGNPDLLEQIIDEPEKPRKTTTTKKKVKRIRQEGITYIQGGQDLDEFYYGRTLDSLENHFDAPYEELGAGEHLYNLFVQMHKKLEENVLVDNKRIEEIIMEKTGIQRNMVSIILWRFVQGAGLIYDKDWSMIGNLDELKDGYKQLKGLWPSAVPNNLKSG